MKKNGLRPRILTEFSICRHRNKFIEDIASDTRRPRLIKINDNLCKGCNICIEYCPLKVFEHSDQLNRKGYYVPIVAREDECVGCRLCELLCPEFAIIVTNE